jgi:hypothetical protein
MWRVAEVDVRVVIEVISDDNDPSLKTRATERGAAGFLVQVVGGEDAVAGAELAVTGDEHLLAESPAIEHLSSCKAVEVGDVVAPECEFASTAPFDALPCTRTLPFRPTLRLPVTFRVMVRMPPRPGAKTGSNAPQEGGTREQPWK